MAAFYQGVRIRTGINKVRHGGGAFSTITGNARQMQFGFRMDF